LVVSIVLILTGFTLINSLIPVDKSIEILVTIIGFFLLLFYFFSKQRLISIHSNGGKAIELITQNMSDSEIDEFFNTLQIAKEERMLLLNNNQ